MISVLIADDHTLFRKGVVAMLESRDDIQVVGEAENGAEVMSKSFDLKPDVILMDIQMPEVNGIDATRRIMDRQQGVHILILTMFEDDDTVFAAMRAGAMGYILKGADQQEMIRAITAVANGEAIFSATIATRVMNFFATAKKKFPAEQLPELTERELEVLGLIAKEYKNKEIANKLVISPKTVRNHITSIFNKLQVSDRSQAIQIARDAGLGERDLPI